jgi:hypothetical protein
MVGGGLGRTPFLAKTIKPFLHKRDVLSYVEALLRTYNQFGRRDNIYKARIKILVHELGVEAFAKEVEAEWQSIKDGALALDPAVVAEIAGRFRYPDYHRLEDSSPELAAARRVDRQFDAWVGNSVANHKVPGYAIATLSLKPEGGTPGDATAAQMDAIAMPSASPRRTSISFPTSSPARGWIIAASPMRVRFRSPRKSRAASATAISPATSAGCTSTFPAASMPAAITMSAISAFSASRRTARSSIRSHSAARPTRMPRSAR